MFHCADCNGHVFAGMRHKCPVTPAAPVGDEATCLSTDLSQLGREAREHVAFLAFSEGMKGRAYGTEALSTAWSWFSKGYAAGREQGAREERERQRRYEAVDKASQVPACGKTAP